MVELNSLDCGCSPLPINFVYLQIGDRFERRDIKVENATESRAIVSGLSEGDVIALVDPDLALRKTKASSGPVTGAASK